VRIQDLTPGLALLVLAPVVHTQPQAAQPAYLTPPPAITSILEAPPTPMVVASPRGDIVVVLQRRSMPPISELSRPMLRLAGLRVDPASSSPHRRPDIVGITLKGVTGGSDLKIDLPAGSTAQPIGFSADGRRFAFAAHQDTGVSLWIVDVAGRTSRQAPALALNAVFAPAPCDWLDDSSALLCHAVPAGRGEPPAPPRVPAGPNIQENSGKASPVPTYQDLLDTAYDETLFEHFGTSHLTMVDAATMKTSTIAQPGLYSRATMSTDGRFVLVERLKRPFSRLVPYDDFAKDVEVWGRGGTRIRAIADLPLADAVPINGVPTGPRAYRWTPTAPAMLVWTEALDGGNPKTVVPYRDRLVTLAAPFSGEPTELVRTEYRYRSVAWTEKGVALVSEYDRAKRWTRTWAVDAPGAQPRKLVDRNAQDAYNDPGQPVMRPAVGTVIQNGDSIYLTGNGSSPEGDRPFLDRLNLKTLATERLFRSEGVAYESVVAVLDPGAGRLLTRRESRTEPPNYFVLDRASSSRRPLTDYRDPAPQLTGVSKQLVTYARRDGVQLSATLYLPPGYKQGERLPVLMWAYPREFTDPSVASQVTGSPNRFTTIAGASHLTLLTQGYAVLDNPTMPIVGPGETANDTYVDQLVASAQAAVDKVVEMGVGDRDRVGIGGHSYGAFMTANLLAHSDLFRAGIARSGAYNRTLTPFGFQNEQRTFWEVPQIYARLSPFSYADKVNEPLLLIHGEADNNTGTFPIQSERFYMALKGHGATVRYVTLPYEAHGYAARESVLHTVTEMLNWMDTWVKNASPRQ